MGQIETSNDAVSIGERLSRLRRILGHERGDDIVVRLVLSGKFDEFDPAFAPTLPRLDEIARPHLIGEVEILIMVKVAVPLQQAKTAKIPVEKIGDLQLCGVAQWAPNPFAG